MSCDDGVDVSLFNVEGKQVEIVLLVGEIFRDVGEERNAGVDDGYRNEAVIALDEFFQ